MKSEKRVKLYKELKLRKMTAKQIKAFRKCAVSGADYIYEMRKSGLKIKSKKNEKGILVYYR